MQSLVLYDSYFGNTQQIAQAVYEILNARGQAQIMHVNDAVAGQAAEADLLIIGSPTRAFSATAPVKGFIKKLPRHSLRNTRVAAFDTRMQVEQIDSKFLHTMVNWFGYAADPLTKQLTGKGGVLAVPPIGFFVKDEKGPLFPGEVERARDWAKGLIA